MNRTIVALAAWLACAQASAADHHPVDSAFEHSLK
jgi:hypothetical protein